MRLYYNFKNPEDLTESDELDELSDNEDEIAGLVIPALQRELLEYGGIMSDEESNLSDRDPSSISDASDWVSDDGTHSDVSDSDVDANDGEDSDMKTNDDPDVSNIRNKGLPGAEEVPNKKPKMNDTSNNDEDEAGCSHLNEEEEDDETVRAIIAAIKKTKDTPPEIKLEDLVTDICFHPERDIIALATVNGDVCIYSYSNEENKLLRTIEVHAKACRDVEFTHDGCSLLTCSKDKSIMVTDMETEKLKKFYESAHDDAINKLYVLDTNLFATGDDGGTVKLWDLRQKNEIFSLKEVDDYISQILSNDSKKLLLVTSGDGYLTTFNIGARKRYVQSEPYDDELTCMGIYRGDSKLVVGSSKGRFYTYNWGQFGYHCDVFPGLKTSLTTMVPITDRIGIVAGEEGVIRACHIAPFRNLGIVGQHSMPVENLDICNSGELIASSSLNNDIRFWNVKYFEDFGNIKYNEKHNQYKEKHHNLPSSKFSNATDFFADLGKAPSDGGSEN